VAYFMPDRSRQAHLYHRRSGWERDHGWKSLFAGWIVNAMRNPRTGILVLVFLTIASVIAASVLPTISQDPAYHNFADSRNLGWLPNAADVLSNIGFVLIGSLGLRLLTKRRSEGDGIFSERGEAWVYIALYCGTVLTGIGSACYHLWPNNDSLVWDRLPMAIIFASFVSSVISERISSRAGLFLLLPFLVAGTGSVIFWNFSERAGMGDLRPYVFVHFYPLLIVPVIMYFFPNRYTRGRDLCWVLGFYALATACEALDKPIFDFLHLVSGHTIKHLLAATAIYCHVRMLSKRQLKKREATLIGEWNLSLGSSGSLGFWTSQNSIEEGQKWRH